MPRNNIGKYTIFPIRYSVSGFSLIELLIVMATMILVFTTGIANFRGSQKRQELTNAVLSVKSDLRFAQELALAGKKPTGCNLLNGYIFDSTIADKYQIVAQCNAPPYTLITVVAEKNIKDKFKTVNLPVFTDVIFNVLGRGVKTAANITINMTNSSGTQTVTVTKGGEIN